MSEILEQPAPPEPLRRADQPLGHKPGNGAVTAAAPSSPAIYYIPREKLSSPWPEHFSQAQAMGFNAALLGSPFAAAEDVSAPHSPPLTTSHDQIEPSLGGGGALHAFAQAAAAARHAGLALLLDIALDHLAPSAVLVHEHPDWFVHAPAGPAFRYLSDSDGTVDWWDSQIAAWQSAGIAGFRCLAATKIPPAVWTRLIAAARARHPGTSFMAWTIGASPTDIAALAPCGFDHAFSSSCWWDYSSPWLNDDADRIAAIGPAIALAAPPGATGWTRDATLRALRFAAAYGAGWMKEAGFCGNHGGLIERVQGLNKLRNEYDILRAADSARVISSAGSKLAVLRRGRGKTFFTITANASLTTAIAIPASQLLPGLGIPRLNRLNGTVLGPAGTLSLAVGELAFFTTGAPANVFLPVAIPVDCDAPRIAIEAITPQVDDGKFPVRRLVGDMVTVQADVITDGHDKLAAELIYRAVDEEHFRAQPMAPLGNDRWEAKFPLERLGRYIFAITAWKDVYATFVDEVTKKHAAGVPTTLELQEGIALVREAAAEGRKQSVPKLQALLERLDAADETTRRGILLSEETIALLREAGIRKFALTSHHVIVDAERLGAAFASWYEIFPRSASGDPNRHGTFLDVITQLPRIAGMGFDVLYFPPIHPIGKINRKGRNNTLTPAPDDPGSPYAIGSEAGGHDALHPELGTMADFHKLRDAAAALGIELAIDFAIQCAPDHPWLKQHPEWFDWRPDGSLRYAENPPKKYEDIVNVDFYAEGARPALWLALRDVVQFWVDQGVKLFRVDNPHTKPLPFWEWLIADIRSRHPDTAFLAEAFTRPKVMYRLAKIGFSQSYTYFTWRNTKAELEEYLTELATEAPRDFFRPHFFVNTPDINPVFLQTSGRPGFLIRAALAATLSGLWGVYNGFELCEATPIPGKEEYFASEKYEIKVWDYDRPGNIVAEITAFNRIRKSNAALRSHLNVEFLPCSNDQIIYFRKFAADGNNVLIAISLDPHNVQEATLELPLWRFNLPDDGQLRAHDLMREFSFTWQGKYQPVRLDPAELPFCIWRLSP
jgi:starch synthase (maltosyl-transferring)